MVFFGVSADDDVSEKSKYLNKELYKNLQVKGLIWSWR